MSGVVRWSSGLSSVRSMSDRRIQRVTTDDVPMADDALFIPALERQLQAQFAATSRITRGPEQSLTVTRTDMSGQLAARVIGKQVLLTVDAAPQATARAMLDLGKVAVESIVRDPQWMHAFQASWTPMDRWAMS